VTPPELAAEATANGAGPGLCTVSELARHLRLSVRTTTRYADDGKFPVAARSKGRYRLFDVTACREALADFDHRAQPRAEAPAVAESIAALVDLPAWVEREHENVMAWVEQRCSRAENALRRAAKQVADLDRDQRRLRQREAALEEERARCVAARQAYEAKRAELSRHLVARDAGQRPPRLAR
jgi:DNA-binding transcriptional MerR regulator